MFLFLSPCNSQLPARVLAPGQVRRGVPDLGGGLPRPPRGDEAELGPRRCLRRGRGAGGGPATAGHEGDNKKNSVLSDLSGFDVAKVLRCSGDA